MSTQPDVSTVDLTRTRIRLKSNVVVRPQVYQGNTYYHIEVAADSRYYRIGHTEYVFVSLLDGQTTFNEALALTARSEGANAFLQDQALQLYSWLLENDIAVFADDALSGHAPGETKSAIERMLPKMNPFWIRIPFGDPNRLIRLLSSVSGWIFSPFATAFGLLLIMAAIIHVLTHRQLFAEASVNVFAADNWLWLLFAWVGLKFLHELGHGLVCHRYGGKVRETGIILAFFAPLAYVDVTSSWGFPSRWQRIHTAVAGMYVELLLASTAVFIWPYVRSEHASHLLYNIIVMASFSTLLFNANPLMKFDGYYILSDLLQIPNLQQRSSEATQQLVQQLLFGLNESSPQTAGSQLPILRTFGIASFLWRIFICCGMTIAASVLFHGAGIMLSVAGVAAWFAVPIWKTSQKWIQVSRSSPARAFRATIATTVAVALVCGVFFLPVPFQTKADGTVALHDGCMVRSKVDGFIESIHVADGEFVNVGDLLLTLRNADVETKWADLQIQIRQESIRRQTAMQDHDAGLVAIAEGNLKSLHSRLQDTQDQFEALQVFATASGRVMMRQADQRLETFVHEGDELLIVDSHQPRELHVLIAQEDLNAVNGRVNDEVQVRLGTRQTISGRLNRVIPRASHRLTEPALAATNGGPLAVRQADTDDPEELRLTEPHFKAIVELPADRVDLPVGERGYVSVGRQDETLGKFLYRAAQDWFEKQLEQAARG